MTLPSPCSIDDPFFLQTLVSITLVHVNFGSITFDTLAETNTCQSHDIGGLTYITYKYQEIKADNPFGWSLVMQGG